MAWWAFGFLFLPSVHLPSFFVSFSPSPSSYLCPSLFHTLLEGFENSHHLPQTALKDFKNSNESPEPPPPNCPSQLSVRFCFINNPCFSPNHVNTFLWSNIDKHICRLEYSSYFTSSPIADEVRRTRKRAGESIKGNSLETQAVQNDSPSPNRQGGTSYSIGLAILGLSGYKTLGRSPKETAPDRQGSISGSPFLLTTPAARIPAGPLFRLFLPEGGEQQPSLLSPLFVGSPFPLLFCWFLCSRLVWIGLF